MWVTIGNMSFNLDHAWSVYSDGDEVLVRFGPSDEHLFSFSPGTPEVQEFLKMLPRYVKTSQFRALL